MTSPAPGTLAWFEVATDDPDGAQRFYGSLFDWSFDADGPAASGGMGYRNIKASDATDRWGDLRHRRPGAGPRRVLHPGRRRAGHLHRRGQLGGSVISQHLDPGPGAPTFAYLRDPSGNQFGVFSPPSA